MQSSDLAAGSYRAKSGCQSRSSRAAFVTLPMVGNERVSTIMARASRRLRASEIARRFGSSINSKSILCASPRMRRMIFAAAEARPCPGTAGPYKPAARSPDAPLRPHLRTASLDRHRLPLASSTVRGTCGRTRSRLFRPSPAPKPRTLAARPVNARDRRTPDRTAGLPMTAPVSKPMGPYMTNSGSITLVESLLGHHDRAGVEVAVDHGLGVAEKLLLQLGNRDLEGDRRRGWPWRSASSWASSSDLIRRCGRGQ